MSVELALRTFPARVPHALPGIAGAWELHARGFDFTSRRTFVSLPLEDLS